MSKISSNKITPSFNLFKFTMKKNIGIIVLLTIFLLLLCPGYTLTRIKYLEPLTNYTENFNTIILLVSIVTSLISAILLLINNHFLYSKNATDVFQAFPLTRTKLLLSRFFGSTIPLLIPTFLIYSSMIILTVSTRITGNIKDIILGFIINIILIHMTSAITLIFILCAGNLFDFIVSFSIVNVGMIFIFMIIDSICSDYLLGYSYNFGNYILKRISPFYFAFYNLSEFLQNNFKYQEKVIFYLLITVFITMLCIIISVLLFKNRKAEKCSTAYAYRFMYVISSVIASFIISYALGIIFNNYSSNKYSVSFWIFAVIGSVLAAISLGAITEKSFKTVKKSIVLGLLSVISLVLVYVVIINGAFGFAFRIPKAEEIKNVSVHGFEIYETYDNPKNVLKLHQKIIEEIKQNKIKKNYNSQNESISIDYTLTNGKKFNRSFNIANNHLNENLHEIMISDENLNIIKNKFKALPNNSAISINNKKYQECIISKAKITQLQNAYIKDLEESTSNIFNEDFTQYSLYSSQIENDEYIELTLNVRNSYKNTIDVLNTIAFNNPDYQNDLSYDDEFNENQNNSSK